MGATPSTDAPAPWRRWVPVLGWAAASTPRSLRQDAIAGATAAAVVIPQAMAYATIAGLPVQTGLYCALVPTAIYALLGTSRALSVSTTSTISLLTAQAIADGGGANDSTKALVLAGTLAVLSGSILFLAGVVRLGFLADFISPQVLSGFKIGVGLVILSDQLGRVLGFTVTGDNFFEKIGSALTHLDETQPTTALLAGVSVVALLALHRFAPRLPGPLLVLGAGIIAVALFNLSDHGVALISPIPAGLPSASLPSLDDAASLLPVAVGIALMTFVESIAAARTFRSGDDPPVDADQELRALGAANGIGSVFGAYPSGGGLSQSAVNDQAGARTQAAGLVTVVGVVLTLTVIAPVFDNLAEATLGAIVLVAALGLVDREPLRELRQINPIQWSMALVPLFGVLVLGTVEGVLLGVLASMVSLFHSLSHAPISVLGRDGQPLPDDGTQTAATESEALLIMRVETVLYYANVRPQLDRVASLGEHADPQPHVVVLDLVGQGGGGMAVADGLQDLKQRLSRDGITLWLSGVRPRMEQTLTHTNAWRTSPIPVYPSASAAVDAYESRP